MINKVLMVSLWLSVLAAPAVAGGPITVRVATFNIIGFDGSNPQFDAAVDILQRVNPDVVCINEVASTVALGQMASAAGYPHVFFASASNAIDFELRSGVLSKYPFLFQTTETAITLSGDGSARDLTRNFAVVTIDIPGTTIDPTLIGNHWKSGTEDIDEFRRSVESIRAMQVVAEFDSAVDAFFVVGDMNDDINDSPDNPTQFFSEPSGAPVSFNLGNDITFPVANGVFMPLAAGIGASNLTVLNPLQLVSQGGEPLDSTRPSSGRRLDYIWHSDAVTLAGSEVYDSRDEGAGGLPKFGAPLPAGTSATASDHLLVFADYNLTPTEGACCQPGGICVEGVDETACLNASGTFYGIGTICDPPLDPPCDPPDIDVVINEVLATHNGPDTGEFIELFGTPNGDLFGLTILVIEGETLSKGLVDLSVPLNGIFLDANGYLVVGDTALAPDIDLGLGDRLENGTQTILLVRGYVQPPGNDVDANDDGVAEANIGQIVDAVGLADSGLGTTDVIYYSAPVVGPQSGAFPAGGARIPNGTDTDSASDWQYLSAALDGSDGGVPVSPDMENLPLAGDGDFDNDGDVDLHDAATFANCFTGAGGGPIAPGCEDGDLDGDGDIDLADHDDFQAAMGGPS